ncbi:PREDICTED: basic salivary proline-rich protein 4-like [Odobenus rosmarus divergens]|uniref:Basic salivary proline-rich protein 4-like n=1 Tax=Odobenus rosmarus divergens TaxID=9708 RepID=A0A2U3VLC8_ODORO|nr:PREDICTED: basic salivary proline-rich protein 4-like [Odobenus rosmarus divergens]
MAKPQWSTSGDARTSEGSQDPRPPPQSTPKQSLRPRPNSSHAPPSPRPCRGAPGKGAKSGGGERSPRVEMTAEQAGKEKGPAGCRRTSPRPGAPAPNGGDQGSERRQAASGKPGQRRRRRLATLPSRLSPPEAEGLRGHGRRQHPGRGHSLTGGEGRSSRRLRQRRGSSSSAGSCRCSRRAGSIPPNHPPPGPPPAPPQPPQPPLQPPLPLQPRRGSANRREEARARAPTATAHNLRPQPAAHA